MVVSLEEKEGIYHNRLHGKRCALCSIGLICVVLIGFACGMMAFWLPDFLAPYNVIRRQLVSDAEKNNIVVMDSTICPESYSMGKTFYEGEQVWKCGDSTCIPIQLRCSGYYECADKSDEEDCEDFCRLGVEVGVRFKCSQKPAADSTNPYAPDKQVCFLTDYTCDGGIDCTSDKTHDESNCPAGSFEFTAVVGNKTRKAYCSPENNLLCEDRQFCIRSDLKCDGVMNCFDGSDEADCKS